MESTLWMGDIEPWMTQEIIMNSFFEYGIKPSSIKMIKDHKLKISKTEREILIEEFEWRWEMFLDEEGPKPSTEKIRKFIKEFLKKT